MENSLQLPRDRRKQMAKAVLTLPLRKNKALLPICILLQDCCLTQSHFLLGLKGFKSVHKETKKKKKKKKNHI